MSNRQTINTDKAPQAIGTYSQAVKAGTTVYISGQIPLVAQTMELLEGLAPGELNHISFAFDTSARFTCAM